MLGRETREGRMRSLWRSGDTPKVVQGRLWGQQQNMKMRLSEDLEATIYRQKQSAGAWDGAVERNDVSIASLWYLRWEQDLEARIEMRPFEAVASQWTLSVIMGDCSKVVSWVVRTNGALDTCWGGWSQVFYRNLLGNACQHFPFCLSVSLLCGKREGSRGEGKEGSLPDNMKNERTAYRERSLVKILISPPI